MRGCSVFVITFTPTALRYDTLFYFQVPYFEFGSSIGLLLHCINVQKLSFGQVLVGAFILSNLLHVIPISQIHFGYSEQSSSNRSAQKNNLDVPLPALEAMTS